jgi:hypothetical protein
MQNDPVMEWRRLTEHYRALGDEELRLLALDYRDLTEAAQQALRAELQTRGLGDPETIARGPVPAPARASTARNPQPAAPLDEEAEADSDGAETEEDSSGEHDYTWKELLCECDEWKQAWQLGRALARAGIDNWPESASRTGHPYSRVFVAADQLEQARLVAAQPIPQDIVEESEAEPSDYVSPTCPGCGTADPVLESTDPVNAWHCEACGRDWTEAAPPESPQGEGATPSAGQANTFFGTGRV